MQKAFKIVLLGYMGSGKSTVGKELAKALQLPFVDLDHFITSELQQSIADLFQEKGVIYFRKKEHELLKKLLGQDSPTVISLGGGTPCYYNTMELLRDQQEVITVYLDLSITQLVQRLWPEKDHRPLIADVGSQEELAEFIGKHLFERRPFYHQADKKIKCDDKSPHEVVQLIVGDLF
ncbi:shikimate kinase [Nonlabens xiamenensis]|uniref:shikimate kinase n=1 Tax=Nonlabens xiamenensis TaxID=2341043 RepID=UPI001F0C33E9|nr:shikimate kinase [Nonlabens xiamenensis]